MRWALWQAKQARLAFFLRGRRGSFGSYFFLTSPLVSAPSEAPLGSAIRSSSSLTSRSVSS